MNPNTNSYNCICDQWRDYRRNNPLNRCVSDFANLLTSGAQVLDIGCGTGYPIAASLAERGHEVTGIDLSEKMIDYACALTLPRASFFVADIMEFKTDEMFDAVIAFDSLWHIPLDQQERVYEIIGNLVRRGGYFLFTHGKNHGTVTGEMFGHPFVYNALSKEEVMCLLYKNGFAVLSSFEDYIEETTGDRELLIVAQKV